MQGVNTVVGSLVSALLWPFRDWPLTGLGVVSLLVAVGVLAAFRLTANQRKLDAAKRQMVASLFEIRLFNDDLRAIARAQIDLLRHYGSYLFHALPPLLWTLVPLALLIGQLQFHYGYDGLRPGESALVTVRLAARAHPSGASRAGAGAGAGDVRRPAGARPSLTLDVPSGLRVETPFVWVPTIREAVWRIRAERDGDYEVRIGLTDEPVRNAAPGTAAPGTAAPGAAGAVGIPTGPAAGKRIVVSSQVLARSPVRPAPTLAGQWWYPAEPPLPADSPFDAIAVTYPERRFTILGFELHWLVVFCLLSLLFAVLCRRVPVSGALRPRA